MKLYGFFKSLLGKVFAVLFRIRLEGRENMPLEGPLLVCPNHISNWDPILIAAVTDRQIRFMAKSSLFRIPLLSTLLKALGVFPVNRGTADPSAIKRAIGHLKDGDAVGVFPQGTRHRGEHPKDSEVKPGAGMIAYRAGADVLPVAIITKKYKIVPFRRVVIRIGKPIAYGELGFTKGSSEEYTRATEMIFGRIVELIGE